MRGQRRAARRWRRRRREEEAEACSSRCWREISRMAGARRAASGSGHGRACLDVPGAFTTITLLYRRNRVCAGSGCRSRSPGQLGGGVPQQRRTFKG
eukprot:3527163-Prymnesium_polylepis.1